MKVLTTGMLVLLLAVPLAGCKDSEPEADAYGNFEATKVTVSAEANGTLASFSVEKDQKLAAGEVVGVVDTTQLVLRRAQLAANREAVRARTLNVGAQVQVLEAQRMNNVRERERTERLLAEEAATRKQLDDLVGQIRVIDEQIQQTATQNISIDREIKSIDAQIAQINDQIRQSRIVNPISGTVLNTYAEPQEVTSFGKPLYRIADLSMMDLRAYLTGDQLARVRLGQAVEVQVDDGKGGLHTMRGTITWISSKAEFTPKTIQTRSERTNLVYAFLVRVPNPHGILKIGMPGEVRFLDNTPEGTPGVSNR